MAELILAGWDTLQGTLIKQVLRKVTHDVRSFEQTILHLQSGNLTISMNAMTTCPAVIMSAVQVGSRKSLTYRLCSSVRRGGI
jgi:hypothetical protein